MTVPVLLTRKSASMIPEPQEFLIPTWCVDSDAQFHEYDAQDRRHIAYVNDRGFFVEPPIEQMLRDFTAPYPNVMHLLRQQGSIAADDATFLAPSFK